MKDGEAVIRRDERIAGKLGPVRGWLRPTGSRPRDRRRRRCGLVLEGLALGLSHRRACAVVGVPQSAWWRWRAPGGVEAVELVECIGRAYELGTQHLEDLALARVQSGDHRSDRLLEFLLASRRPERYSSKRDVRVHVEVTERKVLVLAAGQAEALEAEARAVELVGTSRPASDATPGPAESEGGPNTGARARTDPRPGARSPGVSNSSTHSLEEIRDSLARAAEELPLGEIPIPSVLTPRSEATAGGASASVARDSTVLQPPPAVPPHTMPESDLEEAISRASAPIILDLI